jgi:propionaldehyde dehydrogenase
VLGASFDNNLPCISEKVVIVVEKVAQKLMDCFKNENVYILNDVEAEGDYRKDYCGRCR